MLKYKYVASIKLLLYGENAVVTSLEIMSSYLSLQKNHPNALSE